MFGGRGQLPQGATDRLGHELASVIGYADVEPTEVERLGDLRPREAGETKYNFTKLLAAGLFVIGTRAYAFGPPTRAHFGWGAAIAAALTLASVTPLLVATRGVVLQAPFIVLALSYSGLTLLRLAQSRRTLGSRVTGGVFVNQTAAFSDLHGTGANPAATAAYTDAAFVTGRFFVLQSRRHAPPQG